MIGKTINGIKEIVVEILQGIKEAIIEMFFMPIKNIIDGTREVLVELREGIEEGISELILKKFEYLNVHMMGSYKDIEQFKSQKS